jgi:hypothetical protein
MIIAVSVLIAEFAARISPSAFRQESKTHSATYHICETCQPY